MDTKKFTVVGTTLHEGNTKVRFANDIATRVKTLVKNGHTEIVLFETPTPMTKDEAVRYLLSQPGLKPASLEAAQNKAAEYEPKVPKEKKAKVEKAAKTAKAKSATTEKVKKAVTSIAAKAKAKAAKTVVGDAIATPVANTQTSETDDIPAVA